MIITFGFVIKVCSLSASFHKISSWQREHVLIHFDKYFNHPICTRLKLFLSELF